MDNKTHFFNCSMAILLALFLAGTGLNAQITLERELIGAAAGVATIVSNGGSQELKVDDSFGETMIGYEEGEIIITVGFHQTRTADDNFPPPNLEAETEDGTAKVSVNAYPNPTIERLTVDLGNYQDDFSELRLIDIYGRTVKTQRVNGQERMTFRGLDKLPDANYFLQGISKDGKLHQLAKVLIVTNSSN